MSAGQNKLYAVLAIVLILAGAVGVYLVMMSPTPVSGVAPEVKLTGADGTSVNVTLEEMTEMSTITRNGSYQNSYGNIRGVGEYTGVLISDLVELVGGMLEDDEVKIVASDGYSQTFGYYKVYPNASFWDIQGDMVLAYGLNETVVPDYEDGYKLIFLPEDGYYDNADANATTEPDPYAAGPQCVSNVEEIIVLRESIALVVDVAGTVESYTMTELMDMPFVTGEGRYRRSTGIISDSYTVKGVDVLTLLEEVGTLPTNYTLTAYSSDGWETEYSKAVVEGTQSGYTPAGDPVDVIHSTMVLAYELNGSPIDSEDGPLRMTFINEDGNLTDGSLWAKLVNNLTVTEVPVTALVLEQQNVSLAGESWIEMQLCGQSKLFTCIFGRRF